MCFHLTYAWNSGGFAHLRRREAFPDLPRENGRVFPFAPDDGGDDARGEEPGAAPADGLGLHAPRVPVAAQDLADAAVGHLQDAAGSTLV